MNEKKLIIQYQPLPGQWQTFQTRTDVVEAQQLMEIRAYATGQMHRIIDQEGNLIGLLKP